MLARTSTTRLLIAVATGLAAGAAIAKLPPPAPDDVAKKEKQTEEKKAQAERAQKELEQVQDRIVRRYRAAHGKGALPAPAETGEPKTGELPSGAKAPEVPHPDTGR